MNFDDELEQHTQTYTYAHTPTTEPGESMDKKKWKENKTNVNTRTQRVYNELRIHKNITFYWITLSLFAPFPYHFTHKGIILLLFTHQCAHALLQKSCVLCQNSHIIQIFEVTRFFSYHHYYTAFAYSNAKKMVTKYNDDHNKPLDSLIHILNEICFHFHSFCVVIPFHSINKSHSDRLYVCTNQHMCYNVLDIKFIWRAPYLPYDLFASNDNNNNNSNNYNKEKKISLYVFFSSLLQCQMHLMHTTEQKSQTRNL